MDQLLTTKLFIPPTRSELVSRPRLIQQLNAGLYSKLTLISAPAGFGKSTLISEWVDTLRSSTPQAGQPQNKVGYISLDKRDKDLGRFLAYFIAALNQAEGNGTALGRNTLGMIQSSELPPTEPLLTSLINDIAAIQDRIIIILDDYHSIDSPSLDEALTFLIDHLPVQMHLLVATRVDPQLPLARLRAQSQLTELRAADLRFSYSEAIEFLNKVMGLNLSETDIGALEKQTEGWIAGLQLAALSMQGREDRSGFITSFTGSHRFVLDYLVEEVLEQQSENVKYFLQHTAILTQMNGSLCDALTGQDNGQGTLETLENANLFIVPLDDERRWYRYHHLFSELLLQRLHQIDPEELQILHHKAADWYQQNGFIDLAIEHALHGEDFGRAANLIEDQFDVKYGRGEHTQLRLWFAELPEQWVFSRPKLCILKAWNLFTSGQMEAAEQYLQRTEEVLATTTDRISVEPGTDLDELSESNTRNFQGMAAVIRAFLSFYRGDVPGTIQSAQKALDNLPEQEKLWRNAALIALGDAFAIEGDLTAACKARSAAFTASKASRDSYLQLIASSRLAETLRQQGELQQVIELCEQQMKSATRSGISETVMAGWLVAIWGEALAESNDLDGALERVTKGAEMTRRGKDVALIAWSNLCLLRVLFSRRDFSAAQKLINQMNDAVQAYDLPLWVPNQVIAWQVRIWLAQNNLGFATRWVNESGLDFENELSYLNELEYIALARVLVAKGQLEDAIELLQRLSKATETGGRKSRTIEILNLQAIAFHSLGEKLQAQDTLEQALALAKPGGFIRTFVDEGPAIASILYEILSRGIAPDYVHRLLAAFPETVPAGMEPINQDVSQTGFIEPLSDRELEILQLIAEGLTNPEIGTQLYLALNTVKAHTRNIYSKLGVKNRTQAVSMARTLGIIS